MGNYTASKGRSGKGKAVLRKNLNGNSFAPLRLDLVNSQEFTRLSLSAKATLIHLMGKYNGKNNGNLSASLNNAKSEFNLSPNSLKKSLNELLEANFIELTRQSNNRTCSLYALTCFSVDEVNKSGVSLKPTSSASDKWKKST